MPVFKCKLRNEANQSVVVLIKDVVNAYEGMNISYVTCNQDGKPIKGCNTIKSQDGRLYFHSNDYATFLDNFDYISVDSLQDSFCEEEYKRELCTIILGNPDDLLFKEELFDKADTHVEQVLCKIDGLLKKATEVHYSAISKEDREKFCQGAISLSGLVRKIVNGKTFIMSRRAYDEQLKQNSSNVYTMSSCGNRDGE